MKAVAATAAIALLVSAPQIVRFDGPGEQIVSADQLFTEDAHELLKRPVEIADPDRALFEGRRVWASVPRDDIVVVDCEALDAPTGHPDCSHMRTGGGLLGRVDVD